MKKLLKQTLFLLSIICLFMLVMGATDNPEPQYTIDTPYEYPILPGTQEWIDLGDVFARRKACQIPEEILRNMTTDALLQTVLDYPFLNDIYAFDTFKMGYEVVKRRFTGLQEIETRPDYLEALSNYCLESYSLDEDDKALKDYLAEDIYLMFSLDSNLTTCPYASCQIDIIKTPKGSSVPVVRGRTFNAYCPDAGPGTFTEAKMRADIEADKKKYPYATLLRGTSYNNLPAYNCLSYALYSQSYDNNYWLSHIQYNGNGPWTYFTDGSYKKTAYFFYDPSIPDSLSDIQKGDVLVYGFNESTEHLGPTHVGIVNSLAVPTGVHKVVSKWGSGGLWLHSWEDCPYTEETGRNYSVWRLAA